MKPDEVVELNSDVGNILLTFRKITDWNAVKPLPLPPPLPREPTPPPLAPAINLSPPFYVHVANLPRAATDVDVYYFFGGFDKIKKVWLYRNGDTLRGDCMLHIRNVTSLIYVLKKDRQAMPTATSQSLRVRYVDPLFGSFRDISAHMIDRIRSTSDFSADGGATSFNPRNFGADSRYQGGRTSLKERLTYSRPTSSIAETQAYGRPFCLPSQPPAKEPTHLLLRRNADSVTIKGPLERTGSGQPPPRRPSHNSTAGGGGSGKLKPLSNENSSVVTSELKPLSAMTPGGNTRTFVNSKRGSGPRKSQAANCSSPPCQRTEQESRQSLALREPPPKPADSSIGERRGSKLSSDERTHSKRSRRKKNEQKAAAPTVRPIERPPTKHNNATIGPKTSETPVKKSDDRSADGPPPVVVEKVKNAEVFCGAKPTSENQQVMNKFFDMLYDSVTTTTTSAKKRGPRT